MVTKDQKSVSDGIIVLSTMADLCAQLYGDAGLPFISIIIVEGTARVFTNAPNRDILDRALQRIASPDASVPQTYVTVPSDKEVN